MVGDLTALVGKAYEAALDETQWAAFIDQATTDMGGVGGTLVVVDTAEQSVHRFLPVQRVTDIVDEYLGTWSAFDPQVDQVCRVGRSTICEDRDHIDLSDPATAGYYAWLRERVRLDHHMTAVSVLGSGALRAAVCVHRAVDAGATPAIERQRFQSIFNGLSHALDLGFRHSRKLSAAYWDGISARRPGEAALLVDERGRVARATAAALALVARDDGITLRHDRLECLAPADQAGLEVVIGRSIATAAPSAGAMRVRRRAGGKPHLLVAYPLVRCQRLLAPYEAAALVTIADATCPGEDGLALWRQAFDLTPREAELAGLLRAGHSLESAAATCGIAVSTVRLHLHRIFDKTGTSRQSELIGLLLKFD